MKDVRVVSIASLNESLLYEVEVYDTEYATGLMLCTENGGGTTAWMPRYLIKIVRETEA